MDLRISATDLSVCTGKNACCTKSIEDEILESSEKIFRAQLEDKLIVLRHLINSNLSSFKTFFYNSLNACQEHLDALFDRTYGPFYQRNNQIFDTFFNRLRAYSSPFSEAKVPHIVDRLFEDMFVIMFQLMNPMHTVTGAQRHCMIEGMQEIAPFGDVPKKLQIAVHMEKSLVFWKQFVTGLDQVHNVLEGFMNASVSKECKINLAKMWDCSMCSGQPEAKPCPGLCTNVMKGCLADWAEIDQQWNAVIDSMLKISARLRGAQNLHHALEPLPVQLSEAVMEMQERGVTVSNKVIARCYAIDDVIVRAPRHLSPSRGRRHRRDLVLRSITERAANYGKLLGTLMNSFAERLTTLRGWFTALPKSFCSDSGLVAADGEKCWNGSESAAYTKKEAGDGLAMQKENPEYQAERFLPYRGLFVDERLRLGMLAFRLQNALHGHNYTNYQIEGSAEGDDEDYAEGSGGGVSIVSLYATESSEDSASDVLPHTSSGTPSLVSYGTSIVVLLYLTRRFS
ncbi:unnamed protein product [Heligmosomoides polygyrus]|uniref:Glypican-2 n=1 Tax=Heligmosomoides polygyrus TaxID=6339 RepID=A0A183FT01_HELPZ|nr:unnamed protein product [Heligmosomoides polygyrus]